MATADDTTYYIGKTIQFAVSEILDPNGVAVSSPVVTVTIRQPDGELFDTDVTIVGDEYRALFTPEQPGQHVAVIAATGGGTGWKSTITFFVEGT